MWQYNYTMYPDELCHYGVKGMKWKKRKGGLRSKANKAYNKAIKKMAYASETSRASKDYNRNLREGSRNALASGNPLRIIRNVTTRLNNIPHQLVDNAYYAPKRARARKQLKSNPAKYYANKIKTSGKKNLSKARKISRRKRKLKKIGI